MNSYPCTSHIVSSILCTRNQQGFKATDQSLRGSYMATPGEDSRSVPGREHLSSNDDRPNQENTWYHSTHNSPSSDTSRFPPPPVTVPKAHYAAKPSVTKSIYPYAPLSWTQAPGSRAIYSLENVIKSTIQFSVSMSNGGLETSWRSPRKGTKQYTIPAAR